MYSKLKMMHGLDTDLAICLLKNANKHTPHYALHVPKPVAQCYVIPTYPRPWRHADDKTPKSFFRVGEIASAYLRMESKVDELRGVELRISLSHSTRLPYSSLALR
jgi:hypothetical protein